MRIRPKPLELPGCPRFRAAGTVTVELRPGPRGYAAAFERSVTAPAQAFLATIPVSLDQLTAALALADYLDSHRAMVKITGSNIQTADNKTRADVTQLLTAMNVQNRRFKDAQERMRVVTQGR